MGTAPYSTRPVGSRRQGHRPRIYDQSVVSFKMKDSGPPPSASSPPLWIRVYPLLKGALVPSSRPEMYLGGRGRQVYLAERASLEPLWLHLHLFMSANSRCKGVANQRVYWPRSRSSLPENVDDTCAGVRLYTKASISTYILVVATSLRQLCRLSIYHSDGLQQLARW
jgi:hypothetical protein